MTSQDRYVGVARPPQGVDPEPPRLVVDLTGIRSASAEPVHIEPTYRAVGTASPVEPARPHRYATLAEHRRRLRKAVVRRFELTVWCCAALVAVVMAAVLIGGAPGSTPMVSAGAVPVPVPVPVVSGAAPSGSASAASCFLVPCDRPLLAGPPTLLRIPAIGVTTTLESLAVDAARQLQPPADYAKAGWWTQGVAPGDVGPAVIAGHVDSARSGPAIFYNLHRLKPGDAVQVDRDGQTVTFSVTDVEQYPKNAFPSDRVYQPTPDAELRLITCGGEFDRTLLSYRDNIVVYAVLA